MKLHYFLLLVCITLAVSLHIWPTQGNISNDTLLRAVYLSSLLAWFSRFYPITKKLVETPINWVAAIFILGLIPILAAVYHTP